MIVQMGLILIFDQNNFMMKVVGYIFILCAFMSFIFIKPSVAQHTKTVTHMENQTTITFKGDPVHTNGKLPAEGSKLQDTKLVTTELSEKSLEDYKGKNVILNIFPSVNTGVCAASVRKFNEDAAGLENTVVLCVSKDLPFAQSEFCGAEGIENVEMLSDFRSDFGKSNGLLMVDGPLKGLLSRAVVVLNPQGEVIYTEQVPEIAQEPDYQAALNAIKK